MEEVNEWIKALGTSLTLWEREQLRDSAEVKEAFSSRLHFGTGGIRARMGAGPGRLNCITIAQASEALSRYLTRSNDKGSRVAIAYDTREHSKEFAEVAAATISGLGNSVLLFSKATPTPLLSYIVPRFGCSAGVVITASHNPRWDNGFKVYGPTGCQATGVVCRSISEEMSSIELLKNSLPRLIVDGATKDIEIVSDTIYTSYIDSLFSVATGQDCAGLHVIYSPLGGAGLQFAERVLRRIGAKYSMVSEQCSQDGLFSSCLLPNPEIDETMRMGSAKMLSENADIFLANDPDADRLGVVVNHKGSAVKLSGDEVGLLLLDWICRVTEMPERPVVYTTIASTPLIDIVAKAYGVNLRRTLTGFKYIGEQIDSLFLEGEGDRFFFATEESLGYLKGGQTRDKDGILALLLVCELTAWHGEQGRDLVDALNQLYDSFGHIRGMQVTTRLLEPMADAASNQLLTALRGNPPTSIAGVPVATILDYLSTAPMPGDSMQLLPSADAVQFDLKDGSRVLVRPSGTERKLKFYLFANGETRVHASKHLNEMREDVMRWASELRRGK